MIPKIKRDETNTKITNRDEIIRSIYYYENINSLPSYKNALLTQSKVDKSEVQSIIDAIDYRIDLFNKYESSKNDYNMLEQFYKDNLSYINNGFKELEISNNLNNSVEDLLSNFLNYCMTNEEEGIQNVYQEQIIFDNYKNRFDFLKNNNSIQDGSFHSKVIDIMNRKDNKINKTDDSANDYKENDYLSKTQLLLTPNVNPGHSLTEEDNIQKYGGFIITSIVLQSSIILALLFSLFALFK